MSSGPCQLVGPDWTGPTSRSIVGLAVLLGWPDPAGRPLELELALVGEGLERVVADSRRGLVLAALQLRRPERERPPERLRPCHDGLGRDHRLARAGLVEEADRR